MTCRRPILDVGYYACLHKPNVELRWENVREVTKTGLRLADGSEEAFDVIILSTGFVTGRSLFELRGEGGVDLDGFYKSEGRPMAHRGVCVPGFPNFFLIAGPNTVTRNGSAVFTHEVAVDYIAQLLAPLLRPTPGSDARALTLRVPLAEYRAFNAKQSSALAAGAVAAAACPPSWFRADGGTGANFSTWPGSIYGFWWTMRRVHWKEYEVSDEKGTVVNVGGGRWGSVFGMLVGVGAAVGVGVGWREREHVRRLFDSARWVR